MNKCEILINSNLDHDKIQGIVNQINYLNLKIIDIQIKSLHINVNSIIFSFYNSYTKDNSDKKNLVGLIDLTEIEKFIQYLFTNKTIEELKVEFILKNSDEDSIQIEFNAKLEQWFQIFEFMRSSNRNKVINLKENERIVFVNVDKNEIVINKL